MPKGTVFWWLVGPGLRLLLVIRRPSRGRLSRAAVLVGAAGCGGGTAPVDESVTATITITGTAAGLTRSAPVTVTIGG
ncbi:MAG: hypothetical protein R2882_01010 [Gemmatimonadales bacterium]